MDDVPVSDSMLVVSVVALRGFGIGVFAAAPWRKTNRDKRNIAAVIKEARPVRPCLPWGL